MRITFVALATAALATLPAVAVAAPPAAPKSEKKVFNFDEDTISTDFLKPGTLLIEGATRGRRSSLIEVRLDFVAEILRSADDI